MPIAVVLENSSPRYVFSMSEAKILMHERKVDAIVRVPPTFSADLQRGGAKLQLILYGADSVMATSVQGYVEGAIRQINGGKIAIESRMWFNDTNSSTWYFLPGLIMLISTIVGVFLTALVMAREWERGTLESLFVTPVRLIEILLSKIIPYFCVAMFGFMLCLVAAKFLYSLPIHGSLVIILFASVIYLFVSAKFIAKLEGGRIFQRVATLSSTNEIAQVIDSGEAVLVVTIAPDFEREILSGRAGKLQIITDGRNTMTASVASGYTNFW